MTIYILFIYIVRYIFTGFRNLETRKRNILVQDSTVETTMHTNFWLVSFSLIFLDFSTL